MLARYNEVDPTFADRIMKMAESEVAARTESMRDLSGAEALAVKLGAIATTAVVLLGLSAANVLLVLGYDGVALLVAVPALLYGLARVIEAIRGRSYTEHDEPEADEGPVG